MFYPWLMVINEQESPSGTGYFVHLLEVSSAIENCRRPTSAEKEAIKQKMIEFRDASKMSAEELAYKIKAVSGNKKFYKVVVE